MDAGHSASGTDLGAHCVQKNKQICLFSPQSHQPCTGLWDRDSSTPIMRHQQLRAALPWREEQLLMRQQPPPEQKIQVFHRLEPLLKLKIFSRKRAVGTEGSPAENRISFGNPNSLIPQMLCSCHPQRVGIEGSPTCTSGYSNCNFPSLS